MADDHAAPAGEDHADVIPTIPAVTEQEKEIGNMVRHIC